MARTYDNIADAISAVNDEVSAQTTQIADILEALQGKSGGGFVKVGTAITVPTGGTTGYGQISIPAVDGMFLAVNPSITPNNSNRLPFAVIFWVDTATPSQTAAVMGFNYGGNSISQNTSSQIDGMAYFNGLSACRFSTSATYDLYRLY